MNWFLRGEFLQHPRAMRILIVSALPAFLGVTLLALGAVLGIEWLALAGTVLCGPLISCVVGVCGLLLPVAAATFACEAVKGFSWASEYLRQRRKIRLLLRGLVGALALCLLVMLIWTVFPFPDRRYSYTTQNGYVRQVAATRRYRLLAPGEWGFAQQVMIYCGFTTTIERTRRLGVVAVVDATSEHDDPLEPGP